MKLVVLTNLYPPDVLGGYELLAADVVRGLRARGHTVSVLTTGDGSDADGIARTLQLSRRFGSTAGRDRARHLVAAVANRRAVATFLRRHGAPDAALGMSLRRLGLEPVRAFQQRGIPVVFTVNDDWPVAYAPPRGRTGLRAWLAGLLDHGPLARHTWRGVRVGRTVYLSEAIRAHVLAAGAPLPEGTVCPQGVDLALHAPRPFRPMGTGTLKLLFVGRLHPIKAPDVAIDALACLLRRGVEATLTLAGEPVDASYAAELRAGVARHGVGDAVRWLGYVARTALPDLYRAADVLIFLCRWDGEGQGLTYMEAMACGLPVVAYPMGGARELLDAHPAAARAERCDGEHVADAVLALRDDPDRQRALVDRGLTLVREHASLDTYLATLEAALAAAV